MITTFELAPANAHDVRLASEVRAGAVGFVLGDRNYHSPEQPGVEGGSGRAGARPRYVAEAGKPGPPGERWPRRLSQVRRVETVIGQLVERLRGRRMGARDLRYLVSRWYRRLCAHTLGVVLCQEAGLPPLSFAALLTD